MEKMLVSIVVVNYNGKELLKNVLDSVYGISYRNFEVFVVDNASTDKSAEFVKKKYPKVKVVENTENLGYVGINSAVKYCNGDYIMFLNNDLELDKNCLSEMLALAKSENAAMIAPRLINIYNKSLKSGGTWVSRSFYNGHIRGKNNEDKKEIPYLGVGLIERKVVEMFGYLFDRDYFIYSEDLDLGLRLRLLGLKVVFAQKAVMYHLHSATMEKTKNYKRTFLLEKNLLTTFLKIFSLKTIVFLLPYVIGMRLLGMLKDFLTLDFRNGFARINAVFSVALDIKNIAKKRKMLQNVRKMPDSYVLKVFSEKYMFKPKFNV